MKLIMSENFDSVTAPAIPGTVTLASVSGDVVATSTAQSLSGTNSILVTHASSSMDTVVYSNFPDNSNGNCIVSGSIYTSGTTTSTFSGLYIGVAGKWVDGAANDNAYWIYCQISSNLGLILGRSNLGASTQLASVAAASSTFSLNTWYNLTLSRSGANIVAKCQRNSDGNWLVQTGPSTAQWQSGFGNALVATDASPLQSIPSYGGLLLSSLTGGSCYGDNLAFYDLEPRRRRR